MSRLPAALACLVAATAAQDLQLPGTAAGDAHGFALAVPGDLDGDSVPDLLVGAPDARGDRGALRVYSGANGALLLERRGLGPTDDLGHAVSSVGDVDGDGVPDLLAGAPQWDDDESTPLEPWGQSPGYALVLSGADGSLLFALQGESLVDELADRFGAAVAGPGDLNGDGVPEIAVGEPSADIEGGLPQLGAGRARVYSGADGSPLWSVVGDADRQGAGHALAAPGDLDGDGVPDLLVGVPVSDGPGVDQFDLGGVLFVSGATGLARFIQPALPDFERLGSTVAALGDLDGDGVPDWGAGGDTHAIAFSGAAQVQLARFEAGPALPSGGLRLAGPGDVDGDGLADVLLADPAASGLAGPQAGSVQIRSGATQAVLLQFTGQGRGDAFGRDLAVLATGQEIRLAVGAPGTDGLAGPNAGNVQIVDANPVASPQLVLLGAPGSADGFGSALAAAGDANNDGWGDIVAGAPFDDTSGTEAGRADVFSGRDGTLLFSFQGGQAGHRLGWAVGGAGDVDHDGHADVLAGAPFPLGADGPGLVQLRSGATGQLLRQFSGGAAGDLHGSAVASVGDVSGDGHPDLIVGAPGADFAGPDFGAARVFSGISGVLLHLKAGNAGGTQFGAAVAGVGDVDADGTPDFAVSARDEHASGGPLSGRTRLWSGASGALLMVIDGQAPLDRSGWSIDGAGDVDGDGYADLLVGEPLSDAFGEDRGRAVLVSGATGLRLPSPQPHPQALLAGQAVSGAGDVSLDGLPDVLVGAPGSNVAGAALAGLASVHAGPEPPCATVFGDDAAGQLGLAADGAADATNDGVPDLFVGATTSQGFGGDSGAVLVVDVAQAETPWSSAGAVLPGAAGAAQLSGAGPLLSGSPTTLTLTGAAAAMPTALVVGLSLLAAPVKGGTLVPSTDLLLSGLVTDGAGAWSFGASWPALPPGTAVWMQAWWADGGGRAGFAASNAVKGVVP